METFNLNFQSYHEGKNCPAINFFAYPFFSSSVVFLKISCSATEVRNIFPNPILVIEIFYSYILLFLRFKKNITDWLVRKLTRESGLPVRKISHDLKKHFVFHKGCSRTNFSPVFLATHQGYSYNESMQPINPNQLAVTPLIFT